MRWSATVSSSGNKVDSSMPSFSKSFRIRSLLFALIV
nr:MAG TPA: hypothetical protein [Caudoviricetes sp.]